MGFANEPESNLTSSGYRMNYFLGTPQKKLDINVPEAATIIVYALLFMNFSWLKLKGLLDQKISDKP